MKILQLVTSRQHRGAEVAAAVFSEAFIKAGHQVVFAGLYKPSSRPLTVPGAINADVGASRGMFSLPGFYKLLMLIKRERPDILHANGSDTLKYLVAIRIFLPSCPLVYRNISLVSHWRGRNVLKQFFYRWLMKRVDFVTSVGEASRNDFIKTFNMDPARIEVVRRGIPIPDSLEPSKEESKNAIGMPADESLLVHVGNFSPEKDHAFLIDRFAAIKERVKLVRLVLVGEGMTLAATREKVRNANLESSVTFANLQENIEPYFRAADLMVLTSKVEGVPGVLLEAGAFGVPSVAVNVGGVAEAVVDNKTGRITDADNPEAFVDAVVNLLENREERLTYGLQARQWVIENFDLRKSAERFIAIFAALVKKQ